MQSLLGLTLRLASLYRRPLALVLTGVLVVAVLAQRCARPQPTLALATFNIRDFPAHPGQVTAAFELIRELDVPIVAVQEIGDPATFEAAARRQLGSTWRSVFNDREPESTLQPERLHLVGLAYDQARYTLDFHRTHDDVRVRLGQRAALEVRLLPRAGGPALRVFVVHLKAGGDGEAHELRKLQLFELALVVGDARRSWDEVIVLGDFNATGEADRVALAEFADLTQLIWASESLECTAYWQPGETCQGSALDHVFTSLPPESIVARGPCASEGCEPGERCPIFHREVSDHCPVRVGF